MADEKQNQAKDNEVEQNDLNEVVYFGTRIKEEDKKLFVELGKKLNLTQHELFGKVVSTFLKMESIEGITQNNRGHAEELRGHLDRVLAIFVELITSTENISDILKEQHKDEMKEKQSRIKELETRLDQLKRDKKLSDDMVSRSYEKETSLYKEIDSLKKEISQHNQIVDDKSTIINDKDTSIVALNKDIQALQEEIQGYKHLEVEYKSQTKKIKEMELEIKGLELDISDFDKQLSNKTIETNNLYENQKMLNDRVADLTNEKKEKTTELIKTKEESLLEINQLRAEIKELNNNLVKKTEDNQFMEREYLKEISSLKGKMNNQEE